MKEFLYDSILKECGKKVIQTTPIPSCISDNLKNTIRPYQKEAFQRFLTYYNEEFEGKQRGNYHLLFNMATGSGKTMVMAGLMLYLYDQGYRNFLFFVNSNTIIQKTKENFLNPISGKYLFSDKIIHNSHEIKMREIYNFEDADKDSLNIKFVSIQKLTIDLWSENNNKENGLSLEDFKERKTVIIGDEAHHNNADVWGQLVEKIHKSNYNNILLEFTATTDYENKQVVDKYWDKVLFKYDLSQFRKDKFSKEINLFRSHLDNEGRILQALILNLYRQELATTHGINLKPVILFKAKKTIKESEANKENFHHQIENLKDSDLACLYGSTNVPLIKKAFDFLYAKGLTDNDIVKILRSNFKPENCLSANSDSELEDYQLKLNSLEDENNPIRAIFAVQKLNEGWDVLNLYDIVRLYDGRDSGKNGAGKTTISEAQLIGRGARYYPFVAEEGQDKFMRKYDEDKDNDLRILEELYYHTKEDSKYISELKKVLVENGIFDDDNEVKEFNLQLKEEFKKTDFYSNGKVFFNLRRKKSHDNVTSIKDLKVSKTNIEFTLSSARGSVFNAWNEPVREMVLSERRDVNILNIPKNVVRYALSANPFFYYDNLVTYCPKLKSLSEFSTSNDYLGGMGITFIGDKDHCENITNDDYLAALNELLKQIEAEIKGNDVQYEGTEYTYDYIKNKFKDQVLHLNKNDERAKGQEEFIKDKQWYVYKANYGTSEEKRFVEMFSARYKSLCDSFDNIYVIRNEQVLKIYDSIGRTFEPDFLLFCQQKDGKKLSFQVFIEPKGGHLVAKDKWKEDLLKAMKDNYIVVKDLDNYVITGVPFYNYDNENDFKKELNETLRTII